MPKEIADCQMKTSAPFDSVGRSWMEQEVGCTHRSPIPHPDPPNPAFRLVRSFTFLRPSLYHICIRLQAESVHPFPEWYGPELSRSPPEWYGPDLQGRTLTMLIRSLAFTSDQTPHANGLQCFARHANLDFSLEQCSQPLNLSFKTRVNSYQF